MKKYYNVYFFFILSACLFVFSFSACEKPAFGSDDSVSSDGKVSVTFKIDKIEQLSFENTTSRSVSVGDLCTRFSVALFQSDTKIKTQNQSVDDGTSFGSITMDLSPGTYQLVAIAHNGLGNCTISSPEKITFKDNKLTDTFYYYGTLDVSSATTEQLTLSRPVSMFRMKITDNMPSSVAQMKFYYTGGSSTFNAVSGFGCVNSRQTETFTVDSTYYGKPSVFEVYSFPHESNDVIHVDITALDALGTIVVTESLENINIQPNVITQHTSSFFDSVTDQQTDSTENSYSFQIFDDGRWSDIIQQ